MIDKISFKIMNENGYYEERTLEIESYINDNVLLDHNDTSIDINELLKSIKVISGDFLIFVCLCGDADCGGFGDGIKVIHNLEEDLVHWKFLDYWYYYTVDEEKDFLEEYTFQRSEYIKEVINIVDEFKQKYNYYKEENIDFTTIPSQNKKIDYLIY